MPKKNTEKLERANAIRSGHYTIVRKLTVEVQDIKESYDAHNEEQKQRLQVIKVTLEGKLKTIQQINTNILSLCEVSEIHSEVENSERFTDEIITTLNEIKELTGRSESRQEAHGTGATPVNTTSKLPTLVLSSFNGDLCKWTSFWDSFQSAVHNNRTLSAIDKFNYLNSLLEDAAARTIQGLPLTSQNYEAAVKLLKDRYGKPQQIISAHMDELLKITPCSNDKSVQLRNILDQICVHIRGLQSLGVSAAQYGSLLIPVIMAKLPSQMRIEIARKTSEEVWNIDDILKILKKDVEAREVGESVKASSNKNSQQQNGTRTTPTASTFVTKQNESKTITCVYCGQNHYSSSCKTIEDVKNEKGNLGKGTSLLCLSQTKSPCKGMPQHEVMSKLSWPSSSVYLSCKLQQRTLRDCFSPTYVYKHDNKHSPRERARNCSSSNSSSNCTQSK